MKSYHQPKRKSTIRKYRNIQKRFKELRDKERLRIDDTMKILTHEFAYESQDTIMRILKTEV